MSGLAGKTLEAEQAAADFEVPEDPLAAIKLKRELAEAEASGQRCREIKERAKRRRGSAYAIADKQLLAAETRIQLVLQARLRKINPVVKAHNIAESMAAQEFALTLKGAPLVTVARAALAILLRIDGALLMEREHAVLSVFSVAVQEVEAMADRGMDPHAAALAWRGE